MSSLEDSYRRLLRWYPTDHRRTHEDEMVGVLLATAGPDQTKPTGRERADLLLSALSIWTRRMMASAAHGWSETFAATAVIAASLLAGQSGAWLVIYMILEPYILLNDQGLLVLATSAASVALLIAVLRGRRRASLGLALVNLILVLVEIKLFSVDLSIPFYSAALPCLTAPILTALLVFCSSPRRGIELVGVRRAVWVTLALTIAFTLEFGLYAEQFTLLVAPTVCAALAGLASASSNGRRAALLLALPAAVNMRLLALGLDETGTISFGPLTDGLTILGAVPLVVFLATLMTEVRRRRHRSAPPQPSTPATAA